jgi:hypothetical protein
MVPVLVGVLGLTWSNPGLVDGWLVGDDRLQGAPPLIRGKGEIAECGVSPVHVGEPFEVIEEREAGGTPRREAVTSEQLAFAGGQEALGRRVAEAIAAAPHGPDEPGFAQRRPKARLVD